MIDADRALLARMAEVNASMGQVVVRMMSRIYGGTLDPADLHAVGRALTALGTDMTERANELNNPIINSTIIKIEES